MSSNTTFSHICEVWQPENCIPIEPSAPYDEFLIDIYATFMFVSSSSMEETDEEEEAGSWVTSPTTYKPFRQKLDHLIQDTTSWSTISNMLSQVNVPYHVQPLMIWKISMAAQSMAGALENAHRTTIPMVVLIQVVVEASDLAPSPLTDLDIRAEEEEEEEEEEEDKFGHNSSASVCVICLEEILGATEAAVSMPCSHLYHGDCILHWLQRSRVCPLCRFQMLPESRSKG